MPDFEKSFGNIIKNIIEEKIDERIKEIEKTLKQTNRLFSVPELAEYSGFSATSIYNWLKRPRNPIPHFKIGKWKRVFLPDFLHWLEQYQVGSHEGIDKLARFKETPQSIRRTASKSYEEQ
jgi:predicted DNA-binding transcriptional regulator AlpA